MSQQQQQPITLRVTLTSACLQNELQRVCCFEYNTINIGNHQVYITGDNPNTEKKLREYCAMFWLFHNRKYDTLQTCLNVHSVQRFIAYKYGMQLFELMRYPHRINEHPEAQKFKDMLGDSFYQQSALISSYIQLHHQAEFDVQVDTEEFGVLKFPTSQQMDYFLTRAKVLHGGFEEAQQTRKNQCVDLMYQGIQEMDENIGHDLARNLLSVIHS